MSGKYKTTGCAKFFLVLVVLAPIAYLGASYFNGEDGFGKIKEVFSESSDNRSDESGGEDIFKLKNEVSKYKKDAEFFEKEKIRLEKELKACQSAR